MIAAWTLLISEGKQRGPGQCQRKDDEPDLSAHLYPAVHYRFYVLYYLLGHSKSAEPFLHLFFKYFISRSLPAPSPSHSAVLAHSSVQLISTASSNSAFFLSALLNVRPSSSSSQSFVLLTCFPSIWALCHHPPSSFCLSNDFYLNCPLCLDIVLIPFLF